MALINTHLKPAAVTDFLDNESFKDLFDNANDLIHLIDLEGKIIYVNKSWMHALEYELQEIQDKSIYSFIEDENRGSFIEYRNKIISGDQAEHAILLTIRTKTGKKITLEGFVSLRKKGNKPYYTRGIFRDITAKLENEAKLIEREINLQQLLFNAPDAVIVIDQDSLITYWNPKAEKLFGWTSEEVLNSPLSLKIIPERYREGHDNGMKRYLSTGVAHVLNKTIEITAIDKRGTEFYVSLTISTTIQNGNLSFIAFLRDIREQKKNEQDLLKSREQLELSNQQLEQFAHVASHDMKEPIRKIQIFTDRLEGEIENSMTDQARTYLSKVKTSAERLQSLVDGILNYATAQSIEVSREDVDLNAILKNIETDLELIIQQKNAILNYDPLPTISGVNFLIYQLFYNLINNALKFSKPSTRPVIEITAKKVEKISTEGFFQQKNSSFIEVAVSDNGIGFDPEHTSRIFKTFTRLNNPSEYEGTGLGLALCKNIMDRHHGTISATAENDKGATFRLLFPVYE
ncbi:MAG TPA: PAS domain S-box protein [Flavitalea sp.]|nr:PAS domain S-box protein [Flavitalea sp.]